MTALGEYDGGRILRQADPLGDALTEGGTAEHVLQLHSEILARMPYGVVLVRALDRTIVQANEQFERMFEYGRGELIGRPVSVINAAGAMGPEEKAEVIAAALEANGTWHGELQNVTKHGTVLWCQATISSFDHGTFGTVWVAVHQDITERKRVEEDLQSYQRKMEGLFQTALEINSQRELSPLLEALLQRAAELLGAPMGSLYLMQPDQTTLELTVCHHMPASLVGSRLQRGQGLSGRVAETGQALMVADYAHWEGRVSWFERLDLQRVLGVPLKFKDRVIGVINIADDKSAEPFPTADIQLVKLFADQAALAVENARLLDQTKHRAAELEALYEITRDLSALPSDLRQLLQSLMDRAVELLSANGGGIYLFEPAVNELVVVAATHPTTPVGTRVSIGEGMAGRVAQTRQPLIVDDYRAWPHKLPQYADAPLAAVLEVPMLYRGDLVGVLAVEEDRETTRKFTEADARLLSLFAAQAAAAVYSARLFQQLQQANAGLEQRVADRTAELAAANQRHEYLLSNSPAVIYTAAMEDGLPPTYYSNNVRDQLGYDPDQMLADRKFWIQRVHPDDRPRVLHALSSVRDNGQLVLEYRFRNRAHEYVWIRDSRRVLRSPDGERQEFIGSWIDISDRRGAEDMLRHRLQLEQAIAAISAEFIRAEPAAADAQINKALRAVAVLTQMDRGYVFLLTPDAAAIRNTHEWCRDGIPAHMPDLQRVSIGTATPWIEKLQRFETVRFPQDAAAPAEGAGHSRLAPGQDALSTLLIPLGSAQRLIGFMGFDSVHRAREWLDEDVSMLQVVGEMIANAYLRKQAHDQMSLSLHEKEALLREVHHRVKNNLQVISSLLSLGSQSDEQQEPAALLKSIHGRVQAIALLHETLYRSGNMAQVDAAEYIENLASMVFRFEQTHPGVVALDLDLPHVALNPETAVPVGLIVTELITNGLKHAFPDLHERAQKPEIGISLRPRDDGRYELRVVDNGIGLPPGFDHRRATRMGLQLVYMLADQLNGTVRAGRGPAGGSLFRVTFGQLKYRERSLPYA